jgi:hypothetical protein
MSKTETKQITNNIINLNCDKCGGVKIDQRPTTTDDRPDVDVEKGRTHPMLDDISLDSNTYATRKTIALASW